MTFAEGKKIGAELAAKRLKPRDWVPQLIRSLKQQGLVSFPVLRRICAINRAHRLGRPFKAKKDNALYFRAWRAAQGETYRIWKREYTRRWRLLHRERYLELQRMSRRRNRKYYRDWKRRDRARKKAARLQLREAA